MSFIKKISLIILAIALLSNAAFTRPANDEEIQALKTKIEDITPKMQTNTLDTKILIMPEAIFDELQKILLFSEENMHEAIRLYLLDMDKKGETLNWTMRFNERKPCEATNDNLCFLISVTHIMNKQGKTTPYEETYLAILGNGNWYFIDMSDVLFKLAIAQAYPFIQSEKKLLCRKST